MLIKTPILRKFLGLKRISTLWQEYQRNARQPATPSMRHASVILACVVAIAPFLPGTSFYANSNQATVLLLGACACLALLLRRVIGLRLSGVASWSNSLSLTHTAFALGSIPTAIILLFYSEALFHISQDIAVSPDSHVQEISALWFWAYLIAVSIWASVTEELIFRGMLLSCLRRSRVFSSPGRATAVAVVSSAALFAIGHIQSWGILLSIAIFGIGLGLGVAYVACKENLLPLIVYHAVFDFLSLVFAVFSLK